jgi:phage I-like protein
MMFVTTIKLASGAPIHLRGDGQKASAGEDAKPQWNKLFPVGIERFRGDFPDGIRFDRAFLQAMVDNWNRAGRPHQHVNYDHSSGVAAGWIEDLELRDDGLYALIRWTSKARGHIQADEYRFLSPEFSTDGLDKASGGSQGPTLYGCALLNDPYLEELPRVAASNTQPQTAAKAAGATKMDKAKLIAILGLSANATDEDIEKALKEQSVQLSETRKQLATLTEKTEKLELSSQGSVKLAAELKELREQNVSLASKVTAMEAEKKTAEIDSYVTALVKDGKLTPAQVDGQKKLARGDFASFKEAWDKAPVVVKLGERGITGEATQTTPAEAKEKLTALTESIRKEKGISLSQAREMAITQQPELAKLAFRA